MSGGETPAATPEPSATPGPDPVPAPGGELVLVRILDMSLDAYRNSAEHHDELFREFALIQSREATTGHSVPDRLLSLIAELTGQYSGFSAMPQATLDAALARGDTAVDLTYEMPPSVAAGCLHLATLLNEADEYCRQGNLLTLAPPPDAIAFRDWFLLEFVHQIGGRDPVPWPEYVAGLR